MQADHMNAVTVSSCFSPLYSFSTRWIMADSAADEIYCKLLESLYKAMG